MTSTLVKKASWITYYQLAIAIAIVVVFFTDLDTYLYSAGFAPPPLFVLGAFFAASVPLVSSFVKHLKEIPISLVSWCCVYLMVSLLSFQISLQSEVAFQELRNRILAVSFLLFSALIFSRSGTIILWVRRAILVVVIISILNNFYELMNPAVFSGLNDSGRPAGFYVDPNKAGCALILGLIFSIGVIPKEFRMLLILASYLGIFFTFSRGATLSMPIIISILTVKKVLSRFQVALAAVCLVALISMLGLSGNYLIEQARFLGLHENVIVRIESFTNPSSRNADSDTSRLDIVPFGMQRFSDHPFLGNGIGHTQEWGEIQPHNMYLLYMVEHGFLGFLLFPSIVLLTAKGMDSNNRYIGLSFAVFVLIWGIFSHNILEQRFILTTFALLTAMKMNQPEQSLKSSDLNR